MSSANWNIPFNMTTVTTSLAVAAIIALLGNIWTLNQGQSETNANLKVMTTILDTLAENGKDRYTSLDASKDFANLDERIDVIRQELTKRIDDARNDLSTRISQRNSEMKAADNKLQSRITTEVQALSRRIEELQSENSDMSRKIFIIQDRMMQGNQERSSIDKPVIPAEKFMNRKFTSVPDDPYGQ